MINVSHVLCPIDLSEASGPTFEYARAFARWFEARLTALHVVANPPVGLGAAAAVSPPSYEHYRALRRFVADRAADDGVAVATALVSGEPARAIEAHALEARADLVVAGTHDRRGLPRWFLGSVTDALLHTAPCPLVVVPPRAEGAPPSVPVLLKRLVCAVDFSDASLRAVELAFELAQEAEAKLHLVHVVDVLASMPAPLVPIGPAAAEYPRRLEARAQDKFGHMVPEDAGDRCEPQTRVVRGTPWREIVHEAERTDAGLIVLGLQERGFFDQLLFGSTAESVVRHAGCPVLVARPRQAPREPRAA
jgi:nucleotide-binding universal stress UspA family protein